jgi:hypothetical protein
LADDLIKESKMTAAVMGHKDGNATAAKLGADRYERGINAGLSHVGQTLACSGFRRCFGETAAPFS